MRTTCCTLIHKFAGRDGPSNSLTGQSAGMVLMGGEVSTISRGFRAAQTFRLRLRASTGAEGMRTWFGTRYPIDFIACNTTITSHQTTGRICPGMFVLQAPPRPKPTRLPATPVGGFIAWCCCRKSIMGVVARRLAVQRRCEFASICPTMLEMIEWFLDRRSGSG